MHSIFAPGVVYGWRNYRLGEGRFAFVFEIAKKTRSKKSRTFHSKKGASSVSGL